MILSLCSQFKNNISFFFGGVLFNRTFLLVWTILCWMRFVSAVRIRCITSPLNGRPLAVLNIDGFVEEVSLWHRCPNQDLKKDALHRIGKRQLLQDTSSIKASMELCGFGIKNISRKQDMCVPCLHLEIICVRLLDILFSYFPPSTMLFSSYFLLVTQVNTTSLTQRTNVCWKWRNLSWIHCIVLKPFHPSPHVTQKVSSLNHL